MESANKFCHQSFFYDLADLPCQEMATMGDGRLNSRKNGVRLYRQGNIMAIISKGRPD
jgi:hypothetical protein